MKKPRMLVVFAGFGLTTCIMGCSNAPRTGLSDASSSSAIAERAQEIPGSPAATDVVLRPDHTFIDLKYQVTGQLPETWTLKPMRRGTDETTLFLRDPEHPEASPSIYYRFFDPPMQLTDPKEIDDWLRHTVEQKEEMRLRDGFQKYGNRDIVSRTIGDRQAVTWMAKFTDDGEEWVEYLTRVYSPKGTLLFFLKVPASEFPEMRRKLESVIQSTVFP